MRCCDCCCCCCLEQEKKQGGESGIALYLYSTKTTRHSKHTETNRSVMPPQELCAPPPLARPSPRHRGTRRHDTTNPQKRKEWRLDGSLGIMRKQPANPPHFPWRGNQGGISATAHDGWWISLKISCAIVALPQLMPDMFGGVNFLHPLSGSKLCAPMLWLALCSPFLYHIISCHGLFWAYRKHRLRYR